MRVEITKIEAIIIDASSVEKEQFLIPVWKVGYKVRLYAQDIKRSIISSTEYTYNVSVLEGELSWREDQVDTDKIVEYIKSLFRT